MNKTIIWIFILLVSLLFQFGCDNCDMTNEGDFKLSAEDLHIVPYNGTETLLFKNQAGDSVVFYGSGRHSDLDQQYRGCDNNSDCCDYIYNIGIERTIFAASNESRIYLSLVKNRYSYNDFGIYIDCKDQLILHYSWNNKFGLGCLYSPQSNLMSPVDTIMIAGKEYYSIYELTGTSNTTPDLPIVYYSLIQGIVGFKTIDNVSWRLYN